MPSPQAADGNGNVISMTAAMSKVNLRTANQLSANHSHISFWDALQTVFRMPLDQITYSEKYCDETFEFRHVILPPDIAKLVPKTHLMSETEWRNLGVQQSPGWIHFMVHSPEPHVLLFRRPLPKSERIQPQALLQHTISHGH